MASMTMSWWRSRKTASIMVQDWRRDGLSYLMICLDCPEGQRHCEGLLDPQGQCPQSPGRSHSDAQGVKQGLARGQCG